MDNISNVSEMFILTQDLVCLMPAGSVMNQYYTVVCSHTWLHSVLTWVLPKQVAQQSRVCPVKHILNTHTVRDVFAEALADVLSEKISVGVPLTVRHQKQHPHKTHVGCITNKYPTSASIKGCPTDSLLLSTKVMSYQVSPVWGLRLSAL